MSDNDFQEHVRDDLYQVFIMDSPIPLPLSFIRHVYIVVNDHGTLTRWDVFHKGYKVQDRKGYIHRNFFSPWRGLGLLYLPVPHTGHFFSFTPRLLHIIEGDDNSLARKMVDFINTHGYDYKYYNLYRPYPGPNSNTYVQWLLDHFPEAAVKLPLLAIGKDYKGSV